MGNVCDLPALVVMVMPDSTPHTPCHSSADQNAFASKEVVGIDSRTVRKSEKRFISSDPAVIT